MNTWGGGGLIQIATTEIKPDSEKLLKQKQCQNISPEFCSGKLLSNM
jgi:hypothetical protein